MLDYIIDQFVLNSEADFTEDTLVQKRPVF